MGRKQTNAPVCCLNYEHQPGYLLKMVNIWTEFGISVGPDQTAPKEQSDQGLHCFTIKQRTCPKMKILSSPLLKLIRVPIL